MPCHFVSLRSSGEIRRYDRASARGTRAPPAAYLVVNAQAGVDGEMVVVTFILFATMTSATVVERKALAALAAIRKRRKAFTD